MKGIVSFSVNHPWVVLITVFLITIAFLIQFPKVRIDTDPKHMLPVTSPVRKYNDEVEKTFSLHPDVIALGIMNEEGIFNKTTLGRIFDLTREIQQLPGVITRDVVSLSTTDDVTSQGAELAVKPILEGPPESDAEISSVRERLFGNPLFINRIVSKDGTTTAIYVPIEPTANGKQIADDIRKMLPKEPGNDRFFLAGDPIARDTFGALMFRQMAIFAPIAGMIMVVALWLMFRSGLLVLANMAVAMISIIWSMGLLIGLGYPVHIMSSMSPVFLMAIATDSVHIFNEFRFRLGEVKEKRRAVMETIAAVGGPVFYSDVTTAVGFASLAAGAIIPVKIFGLVVGFGTLVILLMSFTLVPALLVLLRTVRIAWASRNPGRTDATFSSWLSPIGRFAVRQAKWVTLGGLVLLVIGIAGLYRLNVNNNMIRWFKPQSNVRKADRILNEHLGGTSTAYFVVDSLSEDSMKDPTMLRDIEGLQRELERDPRVGKTFSVVDYVKRVNFVLHDNDPSFDRIPDTTTEVGQYLFLFSLSADQRDLDNVVDYRFQKANIFVQLKTWDAGVMRELITKANGYTRSHPLPAEATLRPAGIANFNLVWSQEVLWGMVSSFIIGLVVVLLLLVAQTRSLFWGLLSFIPLLFTVVLIYGIVGLVGKDFDMPIAVLSTLSLGLAVDFAIHFVGRFRQRLGNNGDVLRTLLWTVARPGLGIVLNAILFALGFAVMAFADLTPYITVGVLMASIMLLSAVSTLLLLPALILIFSRIILSRSSAAR